MMKDANDFYKALKPNPVLVVLRAIDKNSAMKSIEACYRGGLRIIEVTLSTPDAVTVLKEAKEKYPDLCLGFGTITSLGDARATDIPEADFIVSPHTEENLMEYYRSSYKFYVPAGSTPSELVKIAKKGFEVQKLFPGSLYLASGVKSILAPLPFLNLIVTGGIKLENAQEVINAGAKAVCAGSNLAKREWMQSDSYDLMQAEAEKWSQIKCE